MFSKIFPPSLREKVVENTVTQMFLQTFNGIESAGLHYFNYPLLFSKCQFSVTKILFPNFSLNLKTFSPENFLTCGNPALLQMQKLNHELDQR